MIGEREKEIENIKRCSLDHPDKDKLSETEKSILMTIKNNNVVVSYNIEDKAIFLLFYDGREDVRLKF